MGFEISENGRKQKMFREMLSLLTKKGMRDLCISSVFFCLYGLSSVAMIVIIFFILLQILNGTLDVTVEPLYKYFVSIVVLVLFKGCCNMIADFKKHSAGFDIVQQIRERMILKLKKFSLGFYTNEKLGEISTVLHKDVDNMSLVVGHMWSRMFGDFLISTIVLTYIISINFFLALIMSISVFIALGLLAMTIKQAKRKENENKSALLDMASFFVEYVCGMSTLKSFANNKVLDEDLIVKTQKVGRLSKASSKYKALTLSSYECVLDLGYLSLLITATHFFMNDTLSIFHFIIVAIIAKEFYKPYMAMETHYMYYISALDSYQRLKKILHAAPLPDNLNGVLPQSNNVVFENVHFTYGQGDFSMKDLNFMISEKTMTALVGESGSGKTTITNLLLRFYDLTEGRITLGGVDIKDIPYDELLYRISIVMQNVQLFDNSIEENIRVGKKYATQEEVIEAAKKARIHDFIMSLPNGYQTKIGESGCLLSGGQKQRISIARAFLKDAPILILDEMTSNVDPINECLLQDALAELAKNRTVLVIAHHLKTIVRADQILVFKKGELLEIGKHEELIKNAGYYAKLWMRQY